MKTLLKNPPDIKDTKKALGLELKVTCSCRSWATAILSICAFSQSLSCSMTSWRASLLLFRSLNVSHSLALSSVFSLKPSATKWQVKRLLGTLWLNGLRGHNKLRDLGSDPTRGLPSPSTSPTHFLISLLSSQDEGKRPQMFSLKYPTTVPPQTNGTVCLGSRPMQNVLHKMTYFGWHDSAS